MSGSALLVPLYVYPFEGAWQPLYDAIAAHPHNQFLVVVNPYNGPGPDALPDANYCREIPKLRSHSNVAVFGYVHVQWAQRQLDTVLQDVETYAAWPEQQNHPHQPLQVDGIFVDETPFAGDAPTLDFLGSLTSMVHRNWPSNDTSGDTPAAWIPVGGTARTPTVIHNPGCMPTPEVLALSDLCVVFEDTWTVFLQRVRDGVFSAAATDPPAPDGSGNNKTPAARTGREEIAIPTTPDAATRGQGQALPLPLPLPALQDNATVKDNGWAADACAALDDAAASASASGVSGVAEKSRPTTTTTNVRDKRAVVVHSVPLPENAVATAKNADAADVAGTTQEQRTRLVREVIVAARDVAGTVFVTELCEGYYERFGLGWREWAGMIGGEE